MAGTDTPFAPDFQHLIEPRPAFVETAAPIGKAPLRSLLPSSRT
jgi:hypothetical protein